MHKRNSGENPKSLLGWFEEVMWKAVPAIKKRTKIQTWKEIQKLKPDADTKQMIVDYFSNYHNIKRTYDLARIFFPEMQDPVRVIKNKRYLDVLEPYSGNGTGASPSESQVLFTTYSDIGAYRRAKERGDTNIRLSHELKMKYPGE